MEWAGLLTLGIPGLDNIGKGRRAAVASLVGGERGFLGEAPAVAEAAETAELAEAAETAELAEAAEDVLSWGIAEEETRVACEALGEALAVGVCACCEAVVGG